LREHARNTHAAIDRVDWQIIAVDTRHPLTPSEAVRAHDRKGA
jgi:homogentisate 1,2-dioxygenase